MIEAEARATHEHVYGRFGEDDPLSWTCGVCGLPKPAAPDPAPLDVERLARALHRSYDRDPAVRRIEWNDLNEADRGMWRRHAAAVIREYAKDPQP